MDVLLVFLGVLPLQDLGLQLVLVGVILIVSAVN
jgi:hypothetical protein